MVSGRRYKVLIAEDDCSVGRMLMMMLADSRVEVDHAATGREALALYRSARARGEPYTVLVLDHAMPDGPDRLDGAEVLSIIREEERDWDTHVILFTNYPGQVFDAVQPERLNAKVVPKLENIDCIDQIVLAELGAQEGERVHA